jgi:hypothetical protein
MKKMMIMLVLFGMFLSGVYGENIYSEGPNGETPDFYASIATGGNIPIFRDESGYYTYTQSREGDIDIGGSKYSYFDLGEDKENLRDLGGYISSFDLPIDSTSKKVKLDFSDPVEFFQGTINKKDYSYSSQDLIEEFLYLEKKKKLSGTMYENIEIKKGEGEYSYLTLTTLDSQYVEIIGIDQDTALELALKAPSMDNIPEHLKPTLVEYTKNLNNLIKIKGENPDLYNAIKANAQASIIQDIKYAENNCLGDSCLNDLELLSNLKNNGFSVHSSQFSPHYDKYDTSKKEYDKAQEEYSEKISACSTDSCKDSLQKDLEEKRNDYESQANLMVQYMDSDSAYEYVINKCQSADSEGCQSMITTFGDGASCADSWFPDGLCTFFSDERLVEQAVAQRMREEKEEAELECQGKTDQAFVDCYNPFFEDELKTIEDKFKKAGYYCPDEKIICNDGELKSCSEEEVICNDISDLTCKSDDYRCKLIKEEVDEVERYSKKETYTETSTAFDVISVIMNPDQDAVLASKLFGFEADYSKLPQWLTEDTASLICLAKIDGYLDTQLETQSEDDVGNQGARGVTQYGCSIEREDEFDGNTGEYVPTAGQPCVEVLADLRAERTQILPNDEVRITYSGYLRAPPTTNISYMLYAVYREENNSNPTLEPLFVYTNGTLNPKTLTAGQDDSFYNTIRIPEDGTLKTPIGAEGVKIFLQSWFSEGSTPEEYVNIITPAYKITASSYRDPLGQREEDEEEDDEEENEADEDNVIENDEILGTACEAVGTC